MISRGSFSLLLLLTSLAGCEQAPPAAPPAPDPAPADAGPAVEPPRLSPADQAVMTDWAHNLLKDMFLLVSLESLLEGDKPERLTPWMVKVILALLALNAGLDVPQMTGPGAPRLPMNPEKMGGFLTLVTGLSKDKIKEIVREHGEEIVEILDGEEELESLPEPVWPLVEGFLGMDRKALPAWPEKVAKVLEAGLSCPHCKAHFEFARLYHPPGKGYTYLGRKTEGLRVLLGFRCLGCGKDFRWDPHTRDTEP